MDSAALWDHKSRMEASNNNAAIKLNKVAWNCSQAYCCPHLYENSHFPNSL